MERIRPFVSFDFKRPERTSRRTKVKITKYYNWLAENAGSFKAVPPPKGRDFKNLQEDVNPTFRRIPGRIKKTEFKVVFAPVSPTRTEIKYDRKRGQWFLEDSGVKEFTFLFKDQDRLVQDPKGYAEEMAQGFPEGTKFRIFNPQGWQSNTAYTKEGKIVSQGGVDAGMIGDEVLRFALAYPKEAADFIMGITATVDGRTEGDDILAAKGEAEYRGRQEKKANNDRLRD